MTLKHTKVSAAGASADPAKVGGDDWNADHQADTDGLLMAVASSTPSTPSAGTGKVYATDLVAGRALPAWLGPEGGARTPLQPFLGRCKVGIYQAIGEATGTQLYGVSSSSNGGVSGGRTITNTNLFTAVRRSVFPSSGSAAGISCGARFNSTTSCWMRGTVAGTGGFTNVWRFGVSDAAAVSDARLFCGLVGTTAALGNVNPSTQLNIIGVGADSGESTLSMMSNDASGTATKVALGANFPANTLSTDLYELALFSAPCGSTVYYRVERLNTGDVATGSLTTDLPAAGQLLSLQLWRNNGTTALAVAVDLVSMYIETDY
jgi:hypothetical protein